jgi:hypothetical protein
LTTGRSWRASRALLPLRRCAIGWTKHCRQTAERTKCHDIPEYGSTRGGDPPGAPHTNGCEDCLRLGTPWVHLRLCLTCGHVGCCDSSPMRHARAHAHTVEHPIVLSFEPGENWRWCYVDEDYV